MKIDKGSITSFARNHGYVLVLITLAVLSHWPWFDFSTTLTFRDWSHWPDAAVRELGSWGSWSSFFNLGLPNVQIYFFPFKAAWAAFANLGLSYDDATKITFLIPIAILGFLTPYYLILDQFKNKTTSFISAVFYGTTTYFLLRQSAHIPIAFVVSLAPLILLTYLRLIRTKSLKWTLLLCLLVTIGISYELRMMLIVLLLITAHFVFVVKKSVADYKQLLILVGGLLALNIYWILPSFFGGVSSEISGVANRGLFGDGLFNLLHAIPIHESSWSGGYPNQEFKVEQVQVYLWIIPIIAFISLLRRKFEKQQLFFFFVAIAGILLTKQSAAPLGSLYGFLYDNVPGFSLYREASKFYLITALAYLFLIPYSVEWIRGYSKRAFLISGLLIVVVGAVNLWPLINRSFETMFISRKIPADYQKLNQLIEKDNHFYRTLWVPVDSRWGTFSSTHPKMSLVSLSQRQAGVELTGSPEARAEDLMSALDANAGSYLDKISVRYIIVPIRDRDNNDDFLVDFGDNRNFYINKLASLPYLKKVEAGMSELVVFENEDYNSKFYDQNNNTVAYTQLSPSKYVIEKSALEAWQLTMSEAYGQGWVAKTRQGMVDSMKSKDGLNSFNLPANSQGKIEIYYSAEKLLALGKIISGVALLVTLALILSYKSLKREQNG